MARKYSKESNNRGGLKRRGSGQIYYGGFYMKYPKWATSELRNPLISVVKILVWGNWTGDGYEDPECDIQIKYPRIKSGLLNNNVFAKKAEAPQTLLVGDDHRQVLVLKDPHQTPLQTYPSPIFHKFLESDHHLNLWEIYHCFCVYWFLSFDIEIYVDRAWNLLSFMRNK